MTSPYTLKTRVTSPKNAKTSISLYFFGVLGIWDHVQGLLQALKFNFPSKMTDLDAYVSSYATFRRFQRFWKVAKPFLMIWEPFVLI